MASQHSRRGMSPDTAKPSQAASRARPPASGSGPPGRPPLPALERDPARVEHLAERKWEENVRLRGFLKSGHLSDGDVDRRFRRLYESVCAEIDCTACANCCKTLPIVLTRAEVKRLAAVLEQSPKDFAESCLRTSEKGKVFASQPCPFLEGTRCSCYEIRPTVCRSYPHLDKRLMASRLLGVIENASTCPIVYNVLEALKCELRHSRKAWR